MEKDNNNIKTGKKLDTGNKSTVKINPTKESLKEQIRQSLEEDREMRRLAAQERAAEREREAKRAGVKSHTPGLHANSIASDYAKKETKSIKWHDKKTKGKYIPGMVSNEEFVNEGDYWHPDPEQDKKLSDRGAKLRAREDATSKPKEDPKKLKPGESYMDYAKRHGYRSSAPKKQSIGDRIKTKLGLKNSFDPEGEVLESAVPGKPAERLGAVTAIPKDERDAARERTLAKAKAARAAREKGMKEEIEMEEGMDMKAFKANRRKLKRREASADAKKRGHVGKEWYNSGRTYSPDEAKFGRANMPDHERSTRHRSAVDPEGEDSNYSADKTKNPKKLRKQKAMGESLSFSDFIAERNRYEKETGKDLKTGKPVTKGGTMGGDDKHSQVMRHMHKVMGSGRMGAGGAIQQRGKKKEKGAPTPGPSVTPAQKVAKRRAAAKASQDFMNDTRGT